MRFDKIKRNQRKRTLRIRRARRLKGKGDNSFSNIEPFDCGDDCTCYGFLAEIMRHPDGEAAQLLGVPRKVSSVKEV